MNDSACLMPQFSGPQGPGTVTIHRTSL